VGLTPIITEDIGSLRADIVNIIVMGVYSTAYIDSFDKNNAKAEAEKALAIYNTNPKFNSVVNSIVVNIISAINNRLSKYFEKGADVNGLSV